MSAARILVWFLSLVLAAPAAAGDWDEVYYEEAARVAPHAARVQRKGDVLHLQLESGAALALANSSTYCESAEDCTNYLFDGVLAGAFVLQVLYYEADEFLLIDGRSGERTAVVARPLDFVAWRSPDDVELAAVTYTGDGETAAPAHLLRDDAGWRLVGDGFDLPVPPP